MAEFVQLNVEEMLPELEQMERVNLFTKSETRKILKKRRYYEYKLRRRTKQKEDYLQYIQYEVNVLSLIKKRRKKTGNHYKKFEIDVAIIQRIHKLFRMVCSRFQDDVKLWLSHIEFSKNRKEKSTISRLYTKMLQVHNRKPDLWILAAKWEFEEHGNTDNARSLLQRGLRFNPEAKHLWLEYFRLELLNADKLRKRRDVLGLAAEDNEDENEETLADVSDAVLAGRVAQIVHKKALEAFPNDVSLCLAFIPICKLFNFSADMLDEIYNDLRMNFSDSPLTWDALAIQCVEKPLISKNKTGKVQERMALEHQACQIYEEGLKHLDTDEMWSLYLKFCISRIPLSPKSNELTNKRLTRSLQLLEKAHECKHLTSEMYQEWIVILVKTSQISQAIHVAEMATTRHTASAQLWKVYLQLQIRSDLAENLLIKIMKKALASVKDKNTLAIRQLMIEWAIATESDQVPALFEDGMSRVREVSGPIKEMYVDWLALTKGVKKTRKEYDRLSKVKPLSVDFFNKFIAIETSQSSSKIGQLRKIYEHALGEYGGTHTDLWLDYIKLELTHVNGDATNAGKIHWRAMKQLDGSQTDKFVTQYTLLQTGNMD